jgi:serine/threonine-protein kinase
LIGQEVLGGGERYEVYLAFDERRYCPVVVKLLRPAFLEVPAARRGLLREHGLATRLAHPGLPRSFGLLDEQHRVGLVLELIDGPRLSTLVRRHGPLPLHQLLPLTVELAGVLHYLAGEQVVHLDVKPSNVVMSGPPRLIDLSLARTVEDAAGLDDVVGTDAYLAPEQADPRRLGPVGPAADVWGLGATLYQALTGATPFPRGGRDPNAAPEQRWPQLTLDPAPLPPDVPPALGQVLLRCLQQDPAARPCPAEVAEGVEPLLAALPRPVLAGLRPR